LQSGALYAREIAQNLFAHGIIPNGLDRWYLEWPFEPLVWAGLLLAGWVYRRAERRVRGWPAVRRLHWFAGLGIIFIALASPIAAYDTALFSVHMVQHILLTMVAAPLLLLGAPLTLALRAVSVGPRRRITRVLNTRVVRVLTHPAVTWVVFAGVLVGSHFSALYNSALENEILHIIEHALYLGTGLLFWWPVIGLDPGGHRVAHPLRIVYLLLMMPVQAFTAVAIYSSNVVLYDHYQTLQRSWGPSLLDDQRGAALVMWIGGDGLVVLSLVFVFLGWMRHEDRRAATFDRRASKDLVVESESDELVQGSRGKQKAQVVDRESE
jgi:cytochrome c oxidase assembly factor CtaG